MRALVLMVVLAASAASASPPATVRTLLEHMARGGRDMRVGDWVTYRLDGGGARVHYWRLAVVGSEKDKLGRDAFWLEMEVGTHSAMRAPLGQLKLLVASGESLGAQGAVTRLIVGYGFDKPQEYSQEALEQALRERPPSPPDPGEPAEKPEPRLTEPPVVQSGQPQRLMTLAGTVSAVPVEVRYRKTVVKRMWMSRDIPVMHLARIEIPGIREALEVADFGVDATPRMRMPEPGAPKVRLEYAEKAFPSLPEEVSAP